MAASRGKKSPFVFLSYSRQDASAAERLKHDLSMRGVNIWSDTDLRAGDPWDRVLSSALERAEVVLVLISRSSIESNWVTSEWQSALARSKRVIPVLVEGARYSDLPPGLSHIQAANLNDGYQSTLDKLERAIYELSASSEPPVAQEVDIDKIVEDAIDRTLKRLGYDTREEPKSVKIDENAIFVIISFDPDMEPAFEAIASAAERVGMVAKRTKDLDGDFQITETILEKIRSAKLVVADLTNERPNVYFELGYARGKGKKIVTLLKKGSKAHFDVSGWNYMEYIDSRPLEQALVERFKKDLKRD